MVQTMKLTLLTIVSLASQLAAATWPRRYIESEACVDSSQFNFDNCTTENIQCLCQSKNYLSTVALCIHKQVTGGAKNRDDAWDHFVATRCLINNNSLSDQMYDDAKEYLKTTNLVVIPEDKEAPVYKPIRVEDHSFHISLAAQVNYLRQKDISTIQGCILVGYWVLIIALTAVKRFLRYMVVRFSQTRVSMERPGKLYRLWQKHIAIPACFGFSHMCKVRVWGISMSIPTRLESVACFVYLLLTIIFLCAPYPYMATDPLYPTHWKQMMRYMSDRTGIIAAIQMPLFTLFALRNNILIWVSGWPYATFNTYHRALARVCYALLIIHAVAKHVFSQSYGASLVEYFYPVPYYRWGVAAMGLMAIMIISAFFRESHYEIFLRLHIAAAVCAYACSIKHLDGLGYKQTIYVSLGLIAGDWVIRVSRILFINVSLFLPPVLGSTRYSFAQASLLEGEVVNLKIRTPVHWKFRPGQYVFVHINKWRVWEGHPFSIVGQSSDGESFQIFCRSRGGHTRGLLHKLAREGCTKNNQMTVSVLVEGPYGVHCPLERYDEVLLIAGGIGITSIIPYVEHLVEHRPDARIVFVWVAQFRDNLRWVDDRLQKLIRASNVDMHLYVIRERGSFEEQLESIAQANDIPMVDIDINEAATHLPESNKEPTLDPTKLDTQVDQMSVTSQSTSKVEETLFGSQSVITLQDSTSVVSPTATAKCEPTMATVAPLAYPHYRHYIQYGVRPDMEIIVRDFFNSSCGSAAVIDCGPPSLMDTVRRAICRHLETAKHGRVDYYEEGFSW
uniref:ferric-chelate reductase (NADPH) n=1 Tax=Blastobotrys adeninivorans TaxID=409370 RepID=A0A060T7K7_BLAAD